MFTLGESPWSRSRRIRDIVLVVYIDFNLWGLMYFIQYFIQYFIKIAQIKISNRNVLFMHDWNFNHDATSENNITTLIASIKVL